MISIGIGVDERAYAIPCTLEITKDFKHIFSDFPQADSED